MVVVVVGAWLELAQFGGQCPGLEGIGGLARASAWTLGLGAALSPQQLAQISAWWHLAFPRSFSCSQASTWWRQSFGVGVDGADGDGRCCLAVGAIWWVSKRVGVALCSSFRAAVAALA